MLFLTRRLEDCQRAICKFVNVLFYLIFVRIYLSNLYLINETSHFRSEVFKLRNIMLFIFSYFSFSYYIFYVLDFIINILIKLKIIISFFKL